MEGQLSNKTFLFKYKAGCFISEASFPYSKCEAYQNSADVAAGL